MIANLWSLLGLAFKQLSRHRIRSLLTVAGVSIGMFLYAAVETMQRSLNLDDLNRSDEDNTLVVYRKNRLCPATPRLPERYVEDIRRIEGVVEVLPVQITVNNCGASLDVITFRGVPTDSLQSYNPNLSYLGILCCLADSKRCG